MFAFLSCRCMSRMHWFVGSCLIFTRQVRAVLFHRGSSCLRFHISKFIAPEYLEADNNCFLKCKQNSSLIRIYIFITAFIELWTTEFFLIYSLWFMTMYSIFSSILQNIHSNAQDISGFYLNQRLKCCIRVLQNSVVLYSLADASNLNFYITRHQNPFLIILRSLLRSNM
jgi:hypothetical protein